MESISANYLAVLAAAIAAFVVGSIYYGTLSKPWLKASGMKEEDANMSAPLFITTFICELIMAFVLAIVIAEISAGQVNVANGVIAALLVWPAFVMMPMIVNHRYGNRGWDLTLIDGVHWLLVLIVMAIVIGLFGS